MGEPLSPPGLIVVVIWRFAVRVVEVFVGAWGGPAGVTAFVAADQGPGPISLIARTSKRYEVPLVSPPKLWLVASPGADWTVLVPAMRTSWVVIAQPLSGAAVHETLAEPSPRDADGDPGAPGTSQALPGADHGDHAPGSGSRLVARTRNRNSTPL